MEEHGSTANKPPPPSTSIVENWVNVLTRNTKNQKKEPVTKLPSNQYESFVEHVCRKRRERTKNK